MPIRPTPFSIAIAACAGTWLSATSLQAAKSRHPTEDTNNPAYASGLAGGVDVAGQPLTSGPFHHPGVLVNRAQLDEIKRRVAAGVEPQKSAFEALEASPFAALDYTPHPVPTVEDGPNSRPDIGGKAEQSDCVAAYAQALLWTITGREVYAKNAIRIMDAWSGTLRGGHTLGNGPVQAAWCGEEFPRAAEIIRCTYPGWSQPEIDRFKAMLTTQFLPSIDHGCTENGNKELAMADALIQIGVFTDSRAAFNLGVKMWRGRVPAYIYLKSDGPKPVEAPGAGPAIWSNKGIQPVLVDGILQESMRDSNHPALALAAIVNAAETARQQGLDLYSEQGRRIMAALEFQAQYLKPNSRPRPANMEFNFHPTWEIAYNNFHDRLGYSLPYLAAVLPEIRPTGVNHNMAFETLTHATLGSVGLPPIDPAGSGR